MTDTHETDCGHSHHIHDENCACEHDHPHQHDENCACGHDHAPRWQAPAYDGELSDTERRVLEALEHFHYLPICRFTLTSSKEDELYAVAMEPVYLTAPDESMDEARLNGAPFASLAAKGLITLDYDIELKQFDYSLYEQSALFAYFRETVAESAARPGFLYDTANLEKGSVALASDAQ